MSTRMQQRRGTSTQWTTGNPVLASGEIGFETDTNQFKVGDGTSTWAALSYFKNLQGLGGTLDEYVLASTKGEPLGVATLDVDGFIPIEQIPSLVGLDAEITTAVNNAVTSLVDGAPTALNTLNEIAAAINDDSNYAGTVVLAIDSLGQDITSHAGTTIGAHGTSGSVVGTDNTQTLINKTISGGTNTLSDIPQSAVISLSFDLSNITGDVSTLQSDMSTAQGTISSHTSSISTLDTDVTTLQGATSGLTDALILKAPIASPTFTGTVSGITKSMVGLGNVDNTTDLLKPISTATQTALDLKADASAITELAQDAVNTALTAGIGITKTYDDAANTLTVAVDTTTIQARVTGVTDTEIGYLDGVTSAIQTQLDAKFATANASTTNITEGTNLYYTDERAQDAIGNSLGSGLSYNDTTGAISVNTSTIQARVTNVSDTEIGYLDGVTSAIQTQLDAKLSSVTAGTTYAPLAAPTFTGTVTLPSTTSIGTVSATEIGYVDGVTSAIQTQLDSKLASATAATTYAPIASPTFTGTVSGITKGMVGLGLVDNTADTSKPVSTAQQTALDLKANLAGPTFTGTVVLPSTTSIGTVSATELGYVDGVTSAIQTQLNAKAPLASPTFTGTVSAADLTLSGNLTVNGTTTTVSSTNLEVTDPLIYFGTGNAANLNDLGIVGHFDDGTYQHTGIVRDATDGKWKFFSGVSTEPSGTIDFTTYTKDALVVGALEATSATIGNVSNTELQYLDGVTSAIQTQLDAKTPELYTFTTDATTTRTLALTDKFKSLKFTSASATTITIPTNASVAFPIGTYIELYQWGAGQLTVTAATPATTSVKSTDSQNKSRTQYSSMVLIKVDTDEWLITGDLTA